MAFCIWAFYDPFGWFNIAGYIWLVLLSIYVVVCYKSLLYCSLFVTLADSRYIGYCTCE